MAGGGGGACRALTRGASDHRQRSYHRDHPIAVFRVFVLPPALRTTERDALRLTVASGSAVGVRRDHLMGCCKFFRRDCCFQAKKLGRAVQVTFAASSFKGVDLTLYRHDREHFSNDCAAGRICHFRTTRGLRVRYTAPVLRGATWRTARLPTSRQKDIAATVSTWCWTRVLHQTSTPVRHFQCISFACSWETV